LPFVLSLSKDRFSIVQPYGEKQLFDKRRASGLYCSTHCLNRRAANWHQPFKRLPPVGLIDHPAVAGERLAAGMPTPQGADRR
jgi:hypothetical protein